MMVTTYHPCPEGACYSVDRRLGHHTPLAGLNCWLNSKSLGYFQRGYAAAYYFWITDRASSQPLPARYYLSDEGAEKIEQRVRREVTR